MKKQNIRKAFGMSGLVFALVLFFGCSSAPVPEVNYYRLQFSGGAGSSSDTRSCVELGSVRLPEYLKRSGVVLEVAENQIHIGSYNLWSESLEAGIERYLSMALESRCQCEDGEVGILDISIQTFHGKDEGYVLLQGAWKTVDGTEKAFSFESGLEDSGYPSLIDAHEDCLDQLAAAVCGKIG